MATIEQVLQKLNLMTREGRTRWRSTGTSGCYDTHLGQYTARVSGRDSRTQGASLQILDERGNILDELRVRDPERTPETAGELRSLQEMARRQALNVDGHLELLLRETEGTASARLVGTREGEITLGGEVWQPMTALIEHLEPQAAAGLAPWLPGAQASRGDAERIRKAIEQARKPGGRMDELMDDAGFSKEITSGGTVYRMGVFRLPLPDVERLEKFLRRSGGFTVNPGKT